jgi:hypothetical protein
MDRFESLLTWRNVRTDDRADHGDRYEEAAALAFNPTICPNCGRPMVRVRTIWRSFQADLEVLECRPCNLSLTQAVRSPRE